MYFFSQFPDFLTPISISFNIFRGSSVRTWSDINNSLGAISIAHEFGVTPDEIRQALKNINSQFT